MKELMLQKEFRLTNQINKKKHAICHYWYFKDIVVNLNQMFVPNFMIYH